jgi:integrase
LRLKDACLLKWNEVDLDAGEIKKVPAKTKRFGNGKVIIPMPVPLMRILSRLARESQFVLPTMAEKYQAHKRQLIADIQNHIQNLCKIETRGESVDGRRKPTVRGYHSLRHFFISATLQTGTSLLSVRRMVGHSSSWMTDRYGHVLDAAESRKAVGLLADAIDTTKPAKSAPEVILREAKAIAESITAKNWRQKKTALLDVLTGTPERK